MSALIPEQRAVSKDPRKRYAPAMRTLNPVYAELVAVINSGAKKNKIALTPDQVRALAAYVTPTMLRVPYARRIVPVGAKVPEDKSTIKLTTRERQAMMGVARGLTAAQIGRRLGIAMDTAKTHMRNAYHALDARNGPHAVAICLKYGLLTEDDIADV